jgi:uncharacterized membrane protein
MLSSSLPFHAIPAKTTLEILTEIITAPATYLALIVIALGLAAWWQRDRLGGLVNSLRGLAGAASNSFGFEAINSGIVKVTLDSAEGLRVTQTGLLNWNVLAIVAALVIVLAILVLGV